MAMHIQSKGVEIIDGTDQGSATCTVSFTFAGDGYSLTLNEENADAFREAVAPYNEAGRRTAKTDTVSTHSDTAISKDATIIRTWAQANGHNIPDRGFVHADVMDAYVAEHYPTWANLVRTPSGIRFRDENQDLGRHG